MPQQNPTHAYRSGSTNCPSELLRHLHRTNRKRVGGPLVHRRASHPTSVSTLRCYWHPCRASNSDAALTGAAKTTQGSREDRLTRGVTSGWPRARKAEADPDLVLVNEGENTVCEKIPCFRSSVVIRLCHIKNKHRSLQSAPRSLLARSLCFRDP